MYYISHFVSCHESLTPSTCIYIHLECRFIQDDKYKINILATIPNARTQVSMWSAPMNAEQTVIISIKKYLSVYFQLK